MQKQLIRSVCSIFLLLLFARVAGAEWYKDYGTAITSIRKGDWAGAIPKLQSAIAARPDEGANVRMYGTNFADYFPHCYLGMAYFYQNNLEAALAEFDKSEKNGVIHQNRELYRRMLGLKTVARARLASASLGNSNNAATQLPVTPVEPPEQPAENPSQQDSQQNTQQPAVTNTVKDLAAIPAGQDEAARNADQYKKAVKTGARKFFEGDYAEAIRLLTRAIRIDPEEAAGHFLLGCAYASEYLLTGHQDQELLKKASTAFRKTRSIDPNYRVMNDSYISPAVLKMYQES